MLGIGTAEFGGKGKVPIGVPELGVAIEQRHRIQGNQFMIVLAQDHGVHFQILCIFAIETGEHLARKFGHLLQSRTGKARILGQLLERFSEGCCPISTAKRFTRSQFDSTSMPPQLATRMSVPSRVDFTAQ